jgi:hypothetical protein
MRMKIKYPKNWNKTTKELFSEERDLSDKEIQWAIAYERDIIRGLVHFPKNGEIYEAIEDVKIDYITHWKVPMTGGDNFILKKNTKIKIVIVNDDPEPISVYADALEYEKLEKEIIPEKIRDDERYGGYSLGIDTIDLNKYFKLIIIKS